MNSRRLAGSSIVQVGVESSGLVQVGEDGRPEAGAVDRCRARPCWTPPGRRLHAGVGHLGQQPLEVGGLGGGVDGGRRCPDPHLTVRHPPEAAGGPEDRLQQKVVVVLPLVPVTPTRSKRPEGWSKKAAASGARASRTFGTTSWGASRSRGRCTHRAAAPASRALPARSWPSTLAPGTQQNSAPGTTVRVSSTTSVTMVPASPRTSPWTAGARLARGARRDVKVMTFEARVVGSDGRRRVRRRPLVTAIPWHGWQPAKA